MAVFNSPIFSDIRGSVGNMTFSRNRDGAYVKQRTTYGGGSSVPQIAQRGAMNSIVNEWHSLTMEELISWRIYARAFARSNRLGKSNTPLAFNVFVSCNRDRIMWNNGLRRVAPPVEEVAALRPHTGNAFSPPDSPIHFEGDNAWFFWLWNGSPESYRPFIFMSLPQLISRNRPIGGYYFLGNVIDTISGGIVIDFEDSYNDLLTRNMMSTDKTLYHGMRVYWRFSIRSEEGMYPKRLITGSTILETL